MNTTITRRNTNSSKQKNQLVADLRELTDRELHELGIHRQAIPMFIDDLVAPVPASPKKKPLFNKVHTINRRRHKRRIELQPKD